MQPRTRTLPAWSLWLTTLGCCAAGLAVTLAVVRSLTVGVLAQGAVRALVCCWVADRGSELHRWAGVGAAGMVLDGVADEDGGRSRERPVDALRLTIEFADGRAVDNLDPPMVASETPDPDRPMLRDGPGTGMVASGSFRDRWVWDMEYRIRPLPPPGPLAFVCAWPARGIPSARVEVDGAAIREAANAAVVLWSHDPFCSNDWRLDGMMLWRGVVEHPPILTGRSMVRPSWTCAAWRRCLPGPRTSPWWVTARSGCWPSAWPTTSS